MDDRMVQEETKVREMGCPRCFHSELRLTLQPDEEGNPEKHVVECGNCGFSFEIDPVAPNWDTIEEAARRRARHAGCPSCQGHRLELSFRCLVETHQCFHVATCQECGAVFIVEHMTDDSRPPILDC